MNDLGVVGAGTMGRGIAQLLSQSGYRVHLFDAHPSAVDEAMTAIEAQWTRAVHKGRLTKEEHSRATARLRPAPRLAELAQCGLVIEAIVEDFDAKAEVFSALEALLPPNAIIATNTSSLSVNRLASGCANPSRVAGMHFFNPVPLMKLVEVVAGERTAPEVVTAVSEVVAKTGHHGIPVGDSPGFIVNHAGRAYSTEALALLDEGVAAPATIDIIAREGGGFPMGPFQLLDLTGLDISIPASEAIYEGFYHDPRLRPSPSGRRRMHAGLLGRKTGEGFYPYASDPHPTGHIHLPTSPDAASHLGSALMPSRVNAGAQDPWAATALYQWLGRIGIEVSPVPGEAELQLVAPLGTDVSSECAAAGFDPARTVGMDVLVGLHRHRTVACTPATTPDTAAAAIALATQDGVPASLIRDSAGLVLQRLIALMVNVGCNIAERRIATPADIDTAVKLGLGYPQGPLGWGDTLGGSTIVRVLDRLVASTGDPRYRACPWLKRRAQLGLPLGHLDAI